MQIICTKDNFLLRILYVKIKDLLHVCNFDWKAETG